jgi:opacity protein-like surface antigen
MKRLLGGLCAVALLSGAGDAYGQVGFGAQLSWADDAEFGIGARAVVDLTPLTNGLEASGSFDYFFPDQPLGADINYWEINANMAYVFAGVPGMAPYAGGGLNIAHASVSVDEFGIPLGASDTDLGLNLLGGARFRAGPVQPFGELRIELGGGEQFVIAGGVIF